MVCPECGEEECGAIVARITARRGVVTWHTFAWYDGDRVVAEPSGTDALHFKLCAYRQACLQNFSQPAGLRVAVARQPRLGFALCGLGEAWSGAFNPSR